MSQPSGGSVNRNYVRILIVDIKTAVEKVNGFTSKPYEQLSDAERYAIRYNIIVAVEALTSLALHIARRALGVRPEAPIHALRALRGGGLLTPRECDELERLVRLRNLLVHRYLVVDDKRIYDSVKRDFELLLSFLQRIESRYAV